MEQIEDFIPLIPGLLDKGKAEDAWDAVMVLLREAVPLIKVADKSKLFSSVLTLLAEGQNATEALNALYSLGKILIILGMDRQYRPQVLAFVASMVIKAKATD